MQGCSLLHILFCACQIYSTRCWPLIYPFLSYLLFIIICIFVIFILLIYFDPNYTNPNWTIEPKTNGRSKFLLRGPVSNRGNELCTCPDLSHSKIWSSQSFTLNGKKTFIKDIQELMLTLHRLGDIFYKRPKLSHLQPRQTCHPWYIVPPPSSLSLSLLLSYNIVRCNFFQMMVL